MKTFNNILFVLFVILQACCVAMAWQGAGEGNLVVTGLGIGLLFYFYLVSLNFRKPSMHL